MNLERKRERERKKEGEILLQEQEDKTKRFKRQQHHHEHVILANTSTASLPCLHVGYLLLCGHPFRRENLLLQVFLQSFLFSHVVVTVLSIFAE